MNFRPILVLAFCFLSFRACAMEKGLEVLGKVDAQSVVTSAVTTFVVSGVCKAGGLMLGKFTKKTPPGMVLQKTDWENLSSRVEVCEEEMKKFEKYHALFSDLPKLEDPEEKESESSEKETSKDSPNPLLERVRACEEKVNGFCLKDIEERLQVVEDASKVHPMIERAKFNERKPTIEFQEKMKNFCPEVYRNLVASVNRHEEKLRLLSKPDSKMEERLRLLEEIDSVKRLKALEEQSASILKQLQEKREKGAVARPGNSEPVLSGDISQKIEKLEKILQEHRTKLKSRKAGIASVQGIQSKIAERLKKLEQQMKGARIDQFEMFRETTNTGFKMLGKRLDKFDFVEQRMKKLEMNLKREREEDYEKGKGPSMKPSGGMGGEMESRIAALQAADKKRKRKLAKQEKELTNLRSTIKVGAGESIKIPILIRVIGELLGNQAKTTEGEESEAVKIFKGYLKEVTPVKRRKIEDFDGDDTLPGDMVVFGK